jgi:hypothetical protein
VQLALEPLLLAHLGAVGERPREVLGGVAGRLVDALGDAVEQRLDDARVELGARAAAQLGLGRRVAEPLAVRPVGDERVVRVAGQDDARGERDVLAGEPVRVAAAVPALVLVADRRGHVAQAGQRSQDPLADDRVLAHEHPLVGGQRTGLVEDLVGDADLADVVQERDRLDLGHFARIEPESPGHRDRQRVDGVGVLARVAVAGLERRRQRADDGPVGLRRARALLLEVAQHPDQRGLSPLQAACSVERLLTEVLEPSGVLPIRHLPRFIDPNAPGFNPARPPLNRRRRPPARGRRGTPPAGPRCAPPASSASCPPSGARAACACG